MIDDKPQLVSESPTIMDVTGGTVELEGLNLVSGMTAVLITADDSEYTLSLTYVDSTHATVTVSAMADEQAGAANLHIRAPTTPATEPADSSMVIAFLPEPDPPE